MIKTELIDQILSQLFRDKNQIESRISYFKMRDYLSQLDIEQLKDLLNDFKI